MNEIKKKYSQKNALHIAVQNGNTEIVKLLLSNPHIDVNAINISILLFFNQIKNDKFKQN